MRISWVMFAISLSVMTASASIVPLDLNTGTILCMTSDSSGSLLIGTRGGGAYRFNLTNAAWESLATPETSPVVNAIATGIDGETFIIGTDYSTARSTDAGKTWNTLCYTKTLSLASITDVTGAQSVLIGTQGSGLLRYDVRTSTLTPLTKGYPIAQVRGILHSPDRPNRIIIGTQSGVFVSQDAGVTWTARNQGLHRLPVRAICLDPSAPDTLFVSTQERDYEVSDYGIVYRSTDEGETWSIAFGEVCLTGVAVDPFHPGRIAATSWYSGVFISESNGDPGSWVPRIDGLTPKRSYCLEFLPEALLAGTCDGIFNLTETEGTWSRSSNGLRAANVRHVRNVPGSPASWFAACDENGLWRSTDNGVSWQRSMNGFQIQHQDVSDIEIDPDNPAYMYTAMDGYFVYRSSDGGNQWSYINPGGYLVIEEVAVDRWNPGRIYASGFFNGLFRSNDRGNTWESAIGNMTWIGCSCTLTLPPDGSVVIVGQHDGDYDRSTDGGTTYTHIRLNSGIWYRTDVHEIIQTSPDGARILFATDRGIHISTDRGEHVSLATPDMSVVVFYSLASAPSNMEIVYAGGDHGRVLRSNNGGASWYEWAPAATLPDGPVKSLQVDPSNPDRVLAGLNGFGLFWIY